MDTTHNTVHCIMILMDTTHNTVHCILMMILMILLDSCKQRHCHILCQGDGAVGGGHMVTGARAFYWAALPRSYRYRYCGPSRL